MSARRKPRTAAERQRRRRRRLRQGMLVVGPGEMPRALAEALVDAGLLDEARSEDPRQICEAVVRLTKNTLPPSG